MDFMFVNRSQLHDITSKRDNFPQFGHIQHPKPDLRLTLDKVGAEVVHNLSAVY